jgi:hypothetical protein
MRKNVMKRSELILKEYACQLSEEDLRQLNMWLGQKLHGDRAAAAEFLSQNKEIDRWLAGANGAIEWFDMMDQIQIMTERELSRRASEKKEVA